VSIAPVERFSVHTLDLGFAIGRQIGQEAVVAHPARLLASRWARLIGRGIQLRCFVATRNRT